MKPSIGIEILDRALFDEIVPLAQKCWEESTLEKDKACSYYGQRNFKIEPDYGVYRTLELTGKLLVIALRDGARLAGYVIGVTYQSMHHCKIMAALGDNIYIEPEFRSYAPVLVKQFEEQLRQRGAETVGWPVNPESYTCTFLKSVGYVADEVVMEKRLCA